MKRLITFFVAMAIVVFSINFSYAADVKAFLGATEKIRNEYVQHRDNVQFRDFDFLLKVAMIEIKAWDETLKNKNTSNEKKMEASKQYLAIISAQYVMMDRYLELCVIPNDANPKSAKKKCAKLRQHIAEGIRALK